MKPAADAKSGIRRIDAMSSPHDGLNSRGVKCAYGLGRTCFMAHEYSLPVVNMLPPFGVYPVAWRYDAGKCLRTDLGALSAGSLARFGVVVMMLPKVPTRALKTDA